LLSEPAEAKKPIQPEKLPASQKRQSASQPIDQPIYQPIYQGDLRVQANGVSKAQAIRVVDKPRRSISGPASSLAFGLSVAGNAMVFIAITGGVLLLMHIAQSSLI
jgi:hypothetical protein